MIFTQQTGNWLFYIKAWGCHTPQEGGILHTTRTKLPDDCSVFLAFLRASTLAVSLWWHKSCTKLCTSAAQPVPTSHFWCECLCSTASFLLAEYPISCSTMMDSTLLASALWGQTWPLHHTTHMPLLMLLMTTTDNILVNDCTLIFITPDGGCLVTWLVFLVWVSPDLKALPFA